MLESSHGKLRIENLSDLVFGLALSLGSVILISKAVQTSADLVANIVLFGFSFVIVIWIWSGYTRTISVISFETRVTFLLNVALLFCVAIEPYLFYVLSLPNATLSFLDFASSTYAANGAAMLFILAGLGYLVLAEEKTRPGGKSLVFNPTRWRRVIYAEIVAGLIFFVSALPPFWTPAPFAFGSYLRFDMWYSVFVAFLIILNIGGRRGAGSDPQPRQE